MNLPFSKKQLFIIGGVVVVAVVLFFVIRGALRPTGGGTLVPFTVWGSDSSQVFEPVLSGYRGIRPEAQVTYREVHSEDLEAALLDALAEGKAPDVVMIGNRDLGRRRNLFAPVPAGQLSLAQFRSLFPAVAEEDFVSDGNIYGIPLYIDTLALLYNREHFDQAAIASPPVTWEEFQEMVPKLRLLNSSGQIIRAGAALGGSQSSIRYAADILNLLFLQNKTQMLSSDRTAATFSRGPGLHAFRFYLQFANAGSATYTWNDTQDESFEAFAAGKVAMMLGYHKDIEALTRRSPFLRIGVAAAPQVSATERLDYASYEGFAVLAQSKALQYGWDFAIYAATNAAAQNSYFENTKRPPALRSVIQAKTGDPDLSVFAKAALTARSWSAPDYDKIKTILDAAIRAVLTGELDPDRALKRAEDQVTELL